MKNKLSAAALILIFIVIGTIRFKHPSWERNEILTWDVFGYYLYLPAAFIHDDVKLEKKDQWLPQLVEKYNPTPYLYQLHPGPKGNDVFLYTAGMAMLYSPFFFTADALAGPLGYEADGLSLPYQLAIAMGCLLYTLIGLIFLRKILLHFFDDRHAAIFMFLIAIGTNYLHLTGFEGIMPHNSLFMLYTLIVWLTIRWHEDHKFYHAVLLGIFMALAILARGSEIVCIFIPLLWGIHNRRTLKEKWSAVLRYKWHVAALAAAMFITALPQMLYWKKAAGLWIYDSYGDAGFSFDSPYILEVLASYKKGWLLYTPLMIFALVGFVSLWKHRREIFWPVLVFFLVNFYIVASWDVWWYAASFGQRALMQSYAVLVLPLGFFFYSLRSKGMVLRAAGYTVASLLVALNIFQLWQFSQGIIHIERMTKDYYWAAFLKTSVTEEDRKLLEVDRSLEHLGVPDNGKDYNHYVYTVNDFEQPDTANKHFDKFAYRGAYSFRLDSTAIFSPETRFIYSDVTDKDHLWIRGTAKVYSHHEYDKNPAVLIISFEKDGKPLKYAHLGLDKLALKTGQWNEIRFDYLTPYIIDENGVIKVVFWHIGKQPIWVDDLIVEIYEPKVSR